MRQEFPVSSSIPGFFCPSLLLLIFYSFLLGVNEMTTLASFGS